MSLNKDKSKKLGVFINFKDFKNNLDEAVKKLTGDLKKFGFRSIQNQNIDHLKLGYGVSVCNIIDELLNIELYRREF
jgi:hypothetical protein